MTRTTTKSKSVWVAVALVLLGAILGNAQTAQEVARTALRSTVLVTVEDESGEPLRYGSGFLVHEGEIVTNFHVVDGATGGYANLVGQTTTYGIQGIVAVDRERDLVVLKIAPSDTPVLRIGNSDTIQVGDPVYAVGNPLGLEGTFSQGVVSAIRQFESGVLFQITAPISPGSSGGPVLNNTGELIGIAVSTVHDGQNLNFAIPANYLMELLDHWSSSMLPQVSSDDTSTLLSHGSKYYHGQGVTQNYGEAARLFRLAADQGSADAQEYLGRMHYYGEGLPKDAVEAARWYRLAAEQGLPSAQTQLALMYEYGWGVTKDLATADRWYRLAAESYRIDAEQGRADAQRSLGYMYYYGQGVTWDYAKAARLFGLAADQGDASAQPGLFALGLESWLN